MAVLAVASIGAAIGGSIGTGAFLGVSAAGWGWAIGSVVGNLLFADRGEDQKISGPRLSDLSVQGSSYGAPIPAVYGSVRLAGNVLWARPLREQINVKEEKGGKGSGPSTTTTTYEYFTSCAVGLCEGPVAGIDRIWADGKLLYEKKVAATTTPATMPLMLAPTGDEGPPIYVKWAGPVSTGGKYDSHITKYLGTDSQSPDPTMEMHDGVGDVPAYRNLAYVVFDDLPVAEFGNRIPQFSFEITVART